MKTIYKTIGFLIYCIYFKKNVTFFTFTQNKNFNKLIFNDLKNHKTIEITSRGDTLIVFSKVPYKVKAFWLR